MLTVRFADVVAVIGIRKGGAMFRFKCSSCGMWHEGMPRFGNDMPLDCYYIPEEERSTRCQLTRDTCVVDGTYFFIQGCIEIPVVGSAEPFIWDVWVSLSETNFSEFVRLLEGPEREHFGPYSGWLSAVFRVYPDTENLKAKVHLRSHGQRPYVELEPTDHPLAIEQRNGISVERVAEMYSAYVHD